jgi:hypothetical protein
MARVAYLADLLCHLAGIGQSWNSNTELCNDVFQQFGLSGESLITLLKEVVDAKDEIEGFFEHVSS